MVSTDASVKGERFTFSADIKKLMGLIINTFYTNKDVFLRETLANASDAIDKIRFESLTNPDALGKETDLRIEIDASKDAKTITIRDNGIGMTKSEMIQNLGTIATSGTKTFMDAIQAGADIQMIGQFGVGFYSVFLVADRVQVRSKHNSDKQHVWESTAGGEFDVYDDSANEHQLQRGTELILHLKDDQTEYLEERRIKDIIHHHCEYLGKKIFLLVAKESEKDVTDDEEDISATPGAEKMSDDKEAEDDEKEADENEATADGDLLVEDVTDEKKKKTKKVKETTKDWEQVNKNEPIWAKRPEDVKESEYSEFYKSISNDWEEPLVHKHFHVEGNAEFKGILFIPKRAPFDLFNNQKKTCNIKLYVRRVFINDDAEELCPEYLRFVKGVVDSEEMPLNISRETLQQNNMMKIIKKNVVKKAIELIEQLSEDKEKYKTFYEHFAKNLKYGVHEDSANRQRLAKLLRFHTTKSAKEPKALSEYVAGMQEHQKDIYYITGESQEAAGKLPFLEKLRQKGLEVLLMTDPIDEYFVQQLSEFDGHKLVSITKEGLELPQSDEEKAAFEALKGELEPFCKRAKELLGARVEKVDVSARMTESPCYISTGRFGWSSRMEQIMKNQALRDTTFSASMSAKKILELNPYHSVVRELARRLKDDTNDPVAKNLVFLLFDTAVLTSGGLSLENPAEYATRIYKLIRLGLNIVEEEPADELPSLEAVTVGEAGAEPEEMEEVD